MKFALILACFCGATQVFGYQSGSGSIEGQVVNLNTGAPVRRAMVNLNLGSGRPVRPGQPPRQYTPFTAETDDQGRFVFPNLPAGGYYLTAQRQGFVNGNNGPNRPGQLFLGAGQQLKGVVLKLAPQSVIAGKVFDRSGDPLERASVSILRQQNSPTGTQWLPASSAQTNDLGEYRLAGISTGRYRLSATYRDYRPTYPNQPLPDKPEMSYVTTYYPDATDIEKAQFVTVSTGAEAHADIRMQMATSVRIRGRVIDPTGSNPNQMASVNVVPQSGSFGGIYGGGIGSGINPAAGSFELSGIVPGDYYLVARKNGPPASSGSMTTLAAVQPITVRDKPIEGIVLTLSPGRDVQGTVQVQGNGAPNLDSLTIQANSLTGLNNGTVSVRGIAGSQFTLKNAPPGRSTIGVFNPPANYFVKSIQYRGKEVPPSGVDLSDGGSLAVVLSADSATLAGRVLDSAGKTVGRARVELFPADSQTARFQSVSVTDINGEFRFRMLSPGEYRIYAWESPNGNYQSNPDFPLQFEGKAKTVKLEAGGNVVADVTVIGAADIAAVTGPAASLLEFPRTRGSLQGKVLDAKTGAPLRNAAVRLSGGGPVVYASGPNTSATRPAAPGESAQTDEQGSFTFRDVEPGMYQLAAECQGFIGGIYGMRRDQSADSLIVGEGQELNKLVVKLAPQAVVTGKVTDESGDPVARSPVSLYSPNLRTGAPAVTVARTVDTGAQGEFRIAGLAAGTYILGVRPTPPLTPAELAALPLPEQPEMRHPVTYYPASLDFAGAKPIAIESGAEVTGLDIKLQKTASFQIRGKVTGMPSPDGARPPVVMLYPAAGPNPLTQATGQAAVKADGSFTIAGVLPGSYLLTARTAVVDARSRLLGGVLPIEVKDKHLDGVQLALKSGTDVKASVSWEKAATVRLNGLFVALQSVYPTGSGSTGQMLGDDETAVTFRNVLPMPHKVGSVNLPSNCSCYVKSIHYGGREIPESGVDPTTGQPFEIVLGSSASIVEGTVVDREGKPVAGAVLAVAPIDNSQAKLRTGYADENGKFYFDNNPPGEYRLLAWEDVAPAALNDAGFLRQFDTSAKVVKLEALGHQTIRLAAIPAK